MRTENNSQLMLSLIIIVILICVEWQRGFLCWKIHHRLLTEKCNKDASLHLCSSYTKYLKVILYKQKIKKKRRLSIFNNWHIFNLEWDTKEKNKSCNSEPVTSISISSNKSNFDHLYICSDWVRSNHFSMTQCEEQSHKTPCCLFIHSYIH